MSFQNITLLLVEEKKSCKLLKKMLNNQLKEFYIAQDGIEAYEIYKKQKPNIILSDMLLPKLSGIELIQKIRQKDHTTRVIMLTGTVDKEKLIKVSELKLTKLLEKPINQDELFEALKLAIDEKKHFAISSRDILELKEDFTWDFSQHTLVRDGEDVRLTPNERKLLNLFFLNLNQVLTYDMIIEYVWEDSDIYSIDNLKTTIKNVRRKLPEGLILSIYGIGFKTQI